MTDSESRTVTREFHASNDGRRRITFDNGRHEEVYEVSIDWPEGGPNERFGAIWVKRSKTAADAVVAALNALSPGAGWDRAALDGYEAIYAAIEPISGYEAKTPDGQRRLVDRLLAGLDNAAARETLRAWLDGTDEQGRFPDD